LRSSRTLYEPDKRWKGENISSSEIEKAILNHPNASECIGKVIIMTSNLYGPVISFSKGPNYIDHL